MPWAGRPALSPIVLPETRRKSRFLTCAFRFAIVRNTTAVDGEEKTMRTTRIERRAFLQGAAGIAAGLMATGAFAQEAARKADAKDFTPIFNKKDLTGWKPEGKAVWTVEDGVLVGVQGPGAAPGDLFTEKEYADFELRVVYKVQWPANSGVWFRYQSEEKAYQADILEYKEPLAYSGTIYSPGKMFLAANTDPKLEKKDDWNTIEIKAEGDHLVVKLNGVVTGDVRDASYDKGRIGFQIHPGDEFKTMKLMVREIAIREL
jgi:hypothetical protein